MKETDKNGHDAQREQCLDGNSMHRDTTGIYVYIQISVWHRYDLNNFISWPDVVGVIYNYNF